MPRRAMVADDEDLVRSLLAEVLADEGFEVIEAGCGDEALALLDQVAPLDLLVTDVHMPGGADGYEVARQARARCAGLGRADVEIGRDHERGLAPDRQLVRCAASAEGADMAMVAARAEQRECEERSGDTADHDGLPEGLDWGLNAPLSSSAATPSVIAASATLKT